MADLAELSGSDVLVLGLGISGRSAARFCAERGARVVAADEGHPELEGAAALPPQIECRLGQPFPDASEFDLVVPSPGVPPARYRAAARRVWGDVELAGRALNVPIVAVTGTNGKSTTTRLVESMLRASGLRAKAAGNVGEPALGLVGLALDVAVLEVSSFQLETTECFRPAVAVILNLTPDHLDRHGSFDAYLEAKAEILAHQRPKDCAVLNFDDPTVRALADRARGRVIPFAGRSALTEGAWLDAGAFVLCDAEGTPRRLVADEPACASGALRENALAALAAASAAGADPERAVMALAGFSGLPHRMEEVGSVAGVRYVDDSKATNPAAAERALEGSGTRVVWIAGGRGKGLDFSRLADTATRHARAAVLLGEAAGELTQALAGRIPVHAADSLEAAVRSAALLARPGDVVLLAPACASQDQFRDFAERGEHFHKAVAALAEEQR